MLLVWLTISYGGRGFIRQGKGFAITDENALQEQVAVVENELSQLSQEGLEAIQEAYGKDAPCPISSSFFSQNAIKRAKQVFYQFFYSSNNNLQSGSMGGLVGGQALPNRHERSGRKLQGTPPGPHGKDYEDYEEDYDDYEDRPPTKAPPRPNPQAPRAPIAPPAPRFPPNPSPRTPIAPPKPNPIAPPVSQPRTPIAPPNPAPVTPIGNPPVPRAPIANDLAPPGPRKSSVMSDESPSIVILAALVLTICQMMR